MHKQKIDYIIGSFSIILSIVVFFFVAVAIYNFYQPDIEAILKPIREISVVNSFAPEPVEKAIYLSSLFILPLALFFFIMWLKRTIEALSDRIITPLYHFSVFSSLAIVLYMIYLALNGWAGPDQPLYQTNYEFYFDSSFINHYPMIYAFILFPLVLYGVFISQRFWGQKNHIYSWLFNIGSFLFGGYLLALVFLINIFNLNFINNSPVFTVHFDSFFYSISQVFTGKTLLVDFNNLYGLYPHFLEPIFRLIGFNMLKFSIVMAVLLTTSFLLLFLFMIKVVKNILLVIMGFATIIYWEYLLGKIVTQDFYFQFTPLRMIFPCIMLYLAAVYFGNKNKILYYLSFPVLSIGVLWNLDVGGITYASWILALCFMELSDRDIGDYKMIAGKCLRHIVNAAIILLFVVMAFTLFAFIRSGQLPNLSQFIIYQKFFYNSGYFMMPMPLFHPWNLVALIYLVGLAYSFINLLRRDNYYRNIIVFLLSILGAGMFVYYQGRSHSWNLLGIAYPAVILLVVFAEDLINGIKEYGIKKYQNLIFVMIIMYFLSFSIFSVIENSPAIYNIINKRISAVNDNSSDTKKNLDFIRRYTVPGEKIFILSGNEGVYYAESHTCAIINTIEFRNIFFKTEIDQLSQFLLNNRDVKVFCDLKIAEIPGFYHLKGIFDIINQNYRPVDVSESKTMYLVKRR